MTRHSRRPLHLVRNERGISLIIALMSTLLLTALGLGLVMITITETMISANFRDGGEAVYAADAGVERVIVPEIADGVLRAEAEFLLDSLPPGTYAIRATVLSGATVLGTTTRPLPR
jgi:hypothetical protein